MEVFEIHVQTEFSAAHYLRGYPGNCANTHGHNWTIEVYVRCAKLDEMGIAIDFRVIKQALTDLTKDFDHSHLNELPIFHNLNPSSENIAKHFYGELGKRINRDGIKVSKVKASESSKTGASYWEE